MKRRLVSLALCGMMLLTGCQPTAVQEEIWELEQENVVSFTDGETVDCWRGYQNGVRESWAVYELSDGTVILLEDDPTGPESDDGYKALGEDVQAAVSAWYESTGKRYDLHPLLQAAYTRCKEEEKEQFQPGRVTQSIASTASNDAVICFATTVNEAIDPDQAQTVRYSAFFDRASGQRLELWSFFSQPEAAVRQAMAAAASTDPAVQERLAAAIDPEHVILLPDHLEVDFPAGAFEGQSSSYTLSVDYTQLAGLLDSRSMPGSD